MELNMSVITPAISTVCWIAFAIYCAVCLFTGKYEMARWCFTMMVLYRIKIRVFSFDIEKEDDN